jgi:inosine-uridine nucleoside N-ribohydrolase
LIKHPHFTPENHSWDAVLENPPRHFVPSSQEAYVEILKVLEREAEDTVSIVAVGPLTNVAKAAEHDPKIFSKGTGIFGLC